MITLDALDAASFPCAGQAEVVGAFSPDVLIAQVLVQVLRVGRAVLARLPLALDVVSSILHLALLFLAGHLGIAAD